MACLHDSGALRCGTWSTRQGRLTPSFRQVLGSVHHIWVEGPETHNQGLRTGGQVRGLLILPSSV